MSGWRLWIAVVAGGFLLGLTLAWVAGNRPMPPPRPAAGIALGEPHPGFRLPDLDGNPVDAEHFSGRTLLVNFWATWCAPCRREMPALQAASERHGERLSVVGIALDDPEPVARFVDEIGVDYTILVGQDEVLDAQQAWGNSAGALPYTVVVDADGLVRWRHYGEVTAEALEQVLARVL